MTEKRKVRNIAELAQIAGVSTSTVSRALSGKGVLNERTRSRIQAIAEEYDFRPSALAQNLRTQRTGAIGVVIPLGHETGQHISDPFFMAIIGYLADHLTERGYDLVLSKVIPKDDKWLDDIIDAQRTDGLIIIGQSDQYSTLERVAAKYAPMVVWGGHRPGQSQCTVGSDNRLGGEIATRHLLERGRRRIAFLGDPRAIEIAQRLDACRDTLIAETGNEPLVFAAHMSAHIAETNLVEFLQSNAGQIDGIFAASDVIAMKALQALAELNLSVPDDIALIGYDDLPIASQTVPPLTTVHQDIERGAELLAERLFQRIDGASLQSVILPPELVVRKST